MLQKYKQNLLRMYHSSCFSRKYKLGDKTNSIDIYMWKKQRAIIRRHRWYRYAVTVYPLVTLILKIYMLKIFITQRLCVVFKPFRYDWPIIRKFCGISNIVKSIIFSLTKVIFSSKVCISAIKLLSYKSISFVHRG